eukprot:comp20944_c0_seq1/m.27996 comp20944_c0_seq1/g.27996  ORF comp20944_c0_seq1/g.27996 comp20944_c0_seq1/m.27996 type:complete len:168 (-) comp20944_c0_seq1:526-1029(-)
MDNPGGKTPIPDALKTYSVLFDHTGFVQSEVRFFLSEFDNTVRANESRHITQSAQGIAASSSAIGRLSHAEEGHEPQMAQDLGTLQTILETAADQARILLKGQRGFERKWKENEAELHLMREPLEASIAQKIIDGKRLADLDHATHLEELAVSYVKKEQALALMARR